MKSQILGLGGHWWTNGCARILMTECVRICAGLSGFLLRPHSSKITIHFRAIVQAQGMLNFCLPVLILYLIFWNLCISKILKYTLNQHGICNRQFWWKYWMQWKATRKWHQACYATFQQKQLMLFLRTKEYEWSDLRSLSHGWGHWPYTQQTTNF